MDVVPTGALPDAAIPDFRNKDILVDLTFPDAQVGTHLRRGHVSGRARADRAAAGAAAAIKHTHYADPERPAYDACSGNLEPLAVEAFRCCSVDGEQLFDQIATSLASGRGGCNLAGRG